MPGFSFFSIGRLSNGLESKSSLVGALPFPFAEDWNFWSRVLPVCRVDLGSGRRDLG